MVYEDFKQFARKFVVQIAQQVSATEYGKCFSSIKTITKEKLLIIMDNTIIAQLDTLSIEQKEKLLHYLQYVQCDDGENEDIIQRKKKIYETYANTIAQLVAKVEVYAHNLPRQISGLIETTFNIIDSTAADEDEDKLISNYEIAYDYEQFVIDILYLTILRLYIKEIKSFKKLFKNFNNKGIKVKSTNVSIMQEINDKLSSISCVYATGKKMIKKKYHLNFSEIIFLTENNWMIDRVYSSKFEIMVDLKNADKDCEGTIILSDATKDAEQLINNCIECYGSVINNGYTSTPAKKIIKYLPKFISAILTIYGVIEILNKFMRANV